MTRLFVHTHLTIKNTGSGFEELLGLFTKLEDKNPTPFNSLIPMPAEIWDTDAGTNDDVYKYGPYDATNEIYQKNSESDIRPMTINELKKQELLKPIKDELFEKYGVKNWLQWSRQNWEASWEASNIKIKYRNPNEAEVKFTTDKAPIKIIKAISSRFPHISFAYDIYSYHDHFYAAFAGGYADDFPFFEEETRRILGNQGGYPAVILSDEFLKFCKRFSKFPIGGCLLRRYQPKHKRKTTKQIIKTSTTKEA